MRRARTAILLVMALVASMLAIAAAPAHALQTAQATVVNATPQVNTPDVNNGIVYSIGQVGSQVFLGGTFTSVSPHGQPGTTFTRNNILAFNATTGVIDTGFVPTVNGEVDTIMPGPAAGEVYIGGSFSTVDGVTMRAALLDTTTGAIVSSWKPSAINGGVKKMVLADGMLFIGGTFTATGGVSHPGLVAVNPTTGKLLTYVNLSFTGHHNYGVNCSGTGCANGAVGIKSFDIDPTGQFLVAVGNFTSVGPVGGTGLPRDQVVYIDLTPSGATVDPDWATDAYTAACFTGAFDSYIRDVQFAPDGSYFVVVGTGGSGTNSDGTNSSCDSAARYETSGTGSDVRPTWIDYTGQDSFWSVSVTGSAVYAGGHERWVNNSMGHDAAAPGAIPRPGIVALDPVNGLPLSWNPGRHPRGDGAYALLATPTGLWVGSDTDYIGDMAILHRKIAFFPLAGGETTPANTIPSLPGRVYTAGAFPASGDSNVLYRLDTAGPTIGAIDNGPDWQGDTSDPSPYRNTGSNTASYGPVAHVDSTVPSSTPSAIFNTERWDPGNDVGDGGNMHFDFPVPAGDVVDVRLYFANRYTGTSQVGQRVFNVNVDGAAFLSHFDIVQAAGDQTGTMRADTVTSDGEVTIDFSHITENPLIDGIEIVKDSGPTSFTTPVPIYRVHAGGAEINATDSVAANWLEDDSDTVGTGGAFRTGGGNVANWGQPWNGTVGPTVPSYVPADLFSTERWAPHSYAFPVAPGTPVNVNLFMANNCTCTAGAGQRVFNVAIDGQPALSNEDIVADTGGTLIGEMKTFSVVAPADGEVTVDLTNGAADNAVINGLEIDQTGATPIAPPVNVDRFSYRHFDGTTVGAETSPSTGIAWGSIRGAFMVNGELVYGKTDGFLYERSYDGSTFGSEVKLDPYDDPFWDNIQTGSGQTYQGVPSNFSAETSSLTSMFYSQGRIFYTVTGSPTMHWRWFETDDGAVGSDEFTVNDGMNWSHVAGAFLSGNTLYYADRTTGELMSVGWSGSGATGTPVVAESSTDWASRGIFMLADATNPNQPPVAAFSATCSATTNACTLDASASQDPDGSITDYIWNYGDGSAIDDHGDGTPFSHNFGAPGTYTVTLTVKDNDGAETTKSMQVAAGQVTPVPTFKGAVSGCGTGNGSCGPATTTTVGVPSTTVAGDALLMFVSWPTNTIAATVPAGWNLLGKQASAALETDVYYKAASAADVGGTETVTFASHTKNSVTVADYSGANATAIESSASAADSTTANHTTPNAPVSVAGSLAVSYWADKSGTTSTWTPPADVKADSTFFDTGTSFTTSMLGHSTSLVGTGTYGGKTATTNAASGKGVEWTIILQPAGPVANQPPNATFTSNCSALTCTFDGTGSKDPDGSIAGYAWDFGDTLGTASVAKPTYTYAGPGTYSVKLTVTDNQGATGSITIPVTVTTSVAKQIGFVGVSNYDGTLKAPTLNVPTGAGAGDALLLFESYNDPSITTSTPSGWTLIGSTNQTSLLTNIYARTAVGGDAGSTVAVNFSAAVKASLTLADYSNATLPVEASQSDTSLKTATHVAPALSGLGAGSWVVSFWTDRATTTTGWTGPAAETQRSVVFGTNSAAVSALLEDSAGPVSGSYPSQSATANVSAGSAAQWSVALSPAS